MRNKLWIVAAVLGLLAIAVFGFVPSGPVFQQSIAPAVYGVSGWGYGTSVASTAATETKAPVAATTSGTYTFTQGMRKVIVFNHPDSGQYLYVKFNADAAGKTNSLYDCVIEPGGHAVFPDENGAAYCWKLGLWIDGAATYGTDYVVQGW